MSVVRRIMLRLYDKKEHKMWQINGGKWTRHPRAWIYSWEGQKQVMSTSQLNGGGQTKLRYVFNYDENPPGGGWCEMRGPTYEDHLRLVSGELGLSHENATGLSTTVPMDASVFAYAEDARVPIGVYCTAGVDINAGRAGEGATFNELDDELPNPKGTINLVVEIGASLPAGTQVQALMTMTEAKSAVLQELAAPSVFTDDLATGSGTDGMILLSNPMSEHTLTNMGKHTEAAESLGRLVKQAVREALSLSTGMNVERQKNLLVRLSRYKGIVSEDLLQDQGLQRIACDPQILSTGAAVLRLADEVRWGLLDEKAAVSTALRLFDMDCRCSDEEETTGDRRIAKLVADWIKRGAAVHPLEREPATDPVTGLCDRKRLEAVLSDEIERGERYGRPFSLILIAIDRFTHVKDQSGHEAGDEMLRSFAGLIKHRIRKMDTACRWGPEAFMILLPETTDADAVVVVEELRRAIEAYDFGNEEVVTASIGVVQWTLGVSAQNVTKCVEEGLKRSRKNGRNRVSVVGVL